jgi:branched-chain amino acid transport system substrate-binding protein
VKRSARVLVLAAAAVLTFDLSTPVLAQEKPPLKIGIAVTYSQPNPLAGQEVDTALTAFFQKYGDTVAGRKVVIVRRDTMGPQPDVARRVVQELIVDEKVDYVVGPDYTPTAIAIKPLSNQAQKPVFIVTAATGGIVADAPYMMNMSYTQTQYGVPMARWAASNGIHTIVQLYADFGAGVESARTFKTAFEAAGGTMLDVIPVPTAMSDFSAYVQRIADKKPDGLYVFLLPGEQPTALLRSLTSAGLLGPGSKLRIMDNGSISDESRLDSIGDSALGILSSFIYSDAHPSALNKDFVARFERISPNLRPDYYAAIVWDCMAAIYHTVTVQKGGSDANATLESLKGYRFESPRGPVELDAATRTITENVYIRRVERRGNHLVNNEIATYPMVKQ